MVSFVILTFFIFPIWPPAAILNFSKRSLVRIGHHVSNRSSDTILQESYVKLTISVPNGFKQKRRNFPMLIIFLIEVKMICICIFLTIDIHENLHDYFSVQNNFFTLFQEYIYQKIIYSIVYGCNKIVVFLTKSDLNGPSK